MKDQIEFHYAYNDDPFIINPNDIRRVSKWGENTMIQVRGEGSYEEIQVSEGYATVKRRIADFYKPLENVSGWPYGE